MELSSRMGLSLRGAFAWIFMGVAKLAFATSTGSPDPTGIFSPASTPADSIYHLSLFVLEICFAIFAVVFSLLVYSAVKFRQRPGDDGREPAQIYGSNQVELAWTVIPILIVVVLFLATARVIHAVEDARFPPDTTEITAVGHQFWWEFQYPQQGFIAANELHVPVSDAKASNAYSHYPAVGRYGPQFLGPHARRKNRPDSQPDEQYVDRPA